MMGGGVTRSRVPADGRQEEPTTSYCLVPAKVAAGSRPGKALTCIVSCLSTSVSVLY